MINGGVNFVTEKEIIRESKRRDYYLESKKLCKENPEAFMVCPRCGGSKLMMKISDPSYFELCDYCNHQGVVAWIDIIFRGKKNPFLEGGI